MSHMCAQHLHNHSVVCAEWLLPWWNVDELYHILNCITHMNEFCHTCVTCSNVVMTSFVSSSCLQQPCQRMTPSIYIYIYKCKCIHICIFIHKYTYMYTYTFIASCLQQACQSVTTPVYVWRYICIYMYICIYIYVCMYIYIYVYIYMYIYVCIYTHIYKYVYIYMYIASCLQQPRQSVTTTMYIRTYICIYI